MWSHVGYHLTKAYWILFEPSLTLRLSNSLRVFMDFRRSTYPIFVLLSWYVVWWMMISLVLHLCCGLITLLNITLSQLMVTTKE
jgi:hypothetical protein